MKFAVLINTHGRADKQLTYKTLRECGYNGKIYLVIDDLDEQKKDYYAKYKDAVKEFDKREYAKNVDTFLNYEMLNTVLYARNASFDIARELKLDWFVMCDDDITRLNYKLVKDGKLYTKKARLLDRFFASCVDFMNEAKIECLSASEEGIYIGGANNQRMAQGLQWQMGHFWIFNSRCERRFRGAYYEDRLFSDASECERAWATSIIADTTPSFKQEKKQEGGMQAMYEKTGLYIPSFLPVMAYPSYERVVIKNGEIKSRRDNQFANVMILSDRWRR